MGTVYTDDAPAGSRSSDDLSVLEVPALSTVMVEFAETSR